MIRLFILSIILFASCKADIKKPVNTPVEDKDTLSNKIDSVIPEKITISMGYTYPFDAGEKEKWLAKTRRAIKKDGNEDSYWDLVKFYMAEDYKYSPNELILLSEIMIKKHNRKSAYLSEYYFYVKNSNPVDTFKMKKGINYLKEILRNSKGKIDFHTVQAGGELSRLYRDGTYVTKDTVIANYLKKGGLNIDSISKQSTKGVFP